MPMIMPPFTPPPMRAAADAAAERRAPIIYLR